MRFVQIPALVAIFVAFALTASATEPKDCSKETPLPDDMQIVKPTELVGTDVARFSGMWGEGKWNGSLCHTLVVERINHGKNPGSATAVVVYSHGRSARVQIPAYVRVNNAKIENGKLSFFLPWGAGSNVSYELKGDSLSGTYYGSVMAVITLMPIVPLGK